MPPCEGMALRLCHGRGRDVAAARILSVFFLLFLTYIGPHVGHEGEEVVSPPLGRMRKRDIVRYYGRRMIRKVGKRPRVFSIAKR